MIYNNIKGQKRLNKLYKININTDSILNNRYSWNLNPALLESQSYLHPRTMSNSTASSRKSFLAEPKKIKKRTSTMRLLRPSSKKFTHTTVSTNKRRSSYFSQKWFERLQSYLSTNLIPKINARRIKYRYSYQIWVWF